RREEITVQRVEHELPRPRRVGIADARRLTGTKRADEIRHEPVAGPIAAADDVPGANADDARRPWQKRMPVCGDGQLRARLAARIRIAPSQPIVLGERMRMTIVRVALVARDYDRHANRWNRTNRFEHVNGTDR